MLVSIEKPSLIEQVEELVKSRNWSCLSRVVNGSGEWALLQWRCEAGHVWSASFNTAERAGCPTCSRVKEKAKASLRSTQRPRLSLWREVALPAQPVLPQETTLPETPKSAKPITTVTSVVKSLETNRTPRKALKTKSRPRLSGIIA